MSEGIRGVAHALNDPSGYSPGSGGILSIRYPTPMVFTALLLLLGIVASVARSSRRWQDEDARLRHSFEVEQHIALASSIRTPCS